MNNNIKFNKIEVSLMLKKRRVSAHFIIYSKGPYINENGGRGSR